MRTRMYTEVTDVTVGRRVAFFFDDLLRVMECPSGYAVLVMQNGDSIRCNMTYEQARRWIIAPNSEPEAKQENDQAIHEGLLSP